MPREKDIETRLEEVERAQRRMAQEIEQLGRELRAQGISIPEMNPAGHTPLSPESRLAALRRAAAKARAAKPVGEGKGAVRSPETASRLASAAEQDDAE